MGLFGGDSKKETITTINTSTSTSVGDIGLTGAQGANVLTSLAQTLKASYAHLGNMQTQFVQATKQSYAHLANVQERQFEDLVRGQAQGVTQLVFGARSLAVATNQGNRDNLAAAASIANRSPLAFSNVPAAAAPPITLDSGNMPIILAAAGVALAAAAFFSKGKR